MEYRTLLCVHFAFSILITATSGQLTCGDTRSCIEDWSGTITPVTEEYNMDTAAFYIKSTLDTQTVYKWQHSECYKCNLFEHELEAQGNWSQRLQTKFPTVIEVFDRQNNSLCAQQSKRLIDNGQHWLIISNATGQTDCQIELYNDPYNQDLNVLWAFLIFLGMALIWILFTMLFKRGKFNPVLNKLHIHGSFDAARSSKVNAAMELESPNDEESRHGLPDATYNNNTSTTKLSSPMKPAKKKRLMSLDAFRGLSLIVMVFINAGSGGYYYFEHAIWNGLTVGDTVFPWFIFIMGTSMAFSFRGLIKRDTPALSVVWKIVWRSIKLFAIGIFLGTHWDNNLKTMRITGVLQRFSLTYLITALVHYPFAKKAIKNESVDRSKIKIWLSDLLPYWPEWIVHLTILGAFLALTYALPVPGCPTGYVGPGGMHDGGKHFNCVGGAAGYIDDLILTRDHIYKWPTSMDIYHSTQAFDPEGILGILSCVFLCFLGLQCGKIIVCFQESKYEVIVRWLVWGLLTGGIGTLLCMASVNDGWVPMNKNLWSVSYILVMAGTSFILLIPMYWIIDVADVWNGAPFIYPGMNSIIIYFCQSAFCCFFPISWAWPDPYEHWEALFSACWASSFWTFVAYILFRKKIFVAL